MASKLKNPTDISGMLGEKVKVKKVARDLVVTNRPRKTAGPPSDKQDDVQSRFKMAANYAKWQLSIPEAKAEYLKKVTSKLTSAFTVAVNDYLNPPKVKGIDTDEYMGVVGDVIRIIAIDDFLVTKVLVTILAANGTELERGNAVINRAQVWEYTTTAANPQVPGTTIKVVAYDRPGNKTAAVKQL